MGGAEASRAAGMACVHSLKNMKCFDVFKKEIYHPILVLAAVILLSCLTLCGCRNKYEDLISAGITVPLAESRIIDVSVKSKIMDRDIPCKVYLPKGYGSGQKYPVWYGLHGHSSNESMWINEVAMDKVADEMIESGEIEPLIMVFPLTMDATLKEIQEDIEDDGKIDERKWDRFMWRELIPYIDAHYDTLSSADSRFIGGFSMGGAIALRVAFHHPDLFSKVAGYTAAVPASDFSGKQFEKWLYPNLDPEEIHDPAQFAREKGLVNLKVYIEAGNENDPFLSALQSLDLALRERGISSEFVIYDGGHSLDNARRCAGDYLRFYAAKK
ncbi:MAG TPA: alpha/beta hydrolase-fold protein [Thermoclostridium caenicola]|nr:alpha/beta hydrolase-fold protein [Thermoclostridium caenicola]